MKKSHAAPRRIVKHTTTKMLLKKLIKADEKGIGPLISPNDFWKEATEGYVGAHLVPKRGYRRILDAGTGMGLASAYLAHRFPGAEILGVDILSTQTRENMWKIITEVFPNVSFVTEDVREAARKFKPDLILGVHNCRELSIIDIELGKEVGADVVLVPCCMDFDALKKRGVDLSHYGILRMNDELKYRLWVIGLAEYARRLGYRVTTGESRMLKTVTNRFGYMKAFLEK